jgi:hypothetical protein
LDPFPGAFFKDTIGLILAKELDYSSLALADSASSSTLFSISTKLVEFVADHDKPDCIENSAEYVADS